MRNFYVCSYGGCGSAILWRKLKEFGNSEHIHSRTPPLRLEYNGRFGKGFAPVRYQHWFNGLPIEEENLPNWTTIFIYKNPINAILSRYQLRGHLYATQLDPNLKLEDVINTGEDLYKIKEFYFNYVTPNPDRNYKIICVKYDDLFDKQNELSEYLGIGSLDLVKKETNRAYHKFYDSLYPIYKEVIDDMENKPFIFES